VNILLRYPAFLPLRSGDWTDSKDSGHPPEAARQQAMRSASQDIRGAVSVHSNNQLGVFAADRGGKFTGVIFDPMARRASAQP
jgi:hypothetical protein